MAEEGLLYIAAFSGSQELRSGTLPWIYNESDTKGHGLGLLIQVQSTVGQGTSRSPGSGFLVPGEAARS